MEKNKIINNEEYRMKILNMLKIYGYYDDILVRKEIESGFVNGEISVDEVINDKYRFKMLKQSVMKLLDYCYENGFSEIERDVNYFYKIMCKDVRKKYGSLFDRI